IHRLASASSLGLWKWYNVSCTSFTVRNGRSTLPLARAAVCRSSAFGGRWVRTRTPRLHITDWHTRDRSEEHTSALQSLMRTSYAVFCLTKNIQLPHHPVS